MGSNREDFETLYRPPQEAMLEYEPLRAGVDRLEKFLATRGIRCADNSRLAEYVGALRHYFDGGKGRPRVRDLHRAVHELSELVLAVDVLGDDPALPAKLKLVVAGEYHPEFERDQNQARDAQFELHLAAVCRAAGLEARLTEPDIRIETSTGPVGLAAKRPRNDKSVVANVRSACKQIRRAGIPGVISLEVTSCSMLTPEGLFLAGFAERPEQVPLYMRSLVIGFLNRNMRAVIREVRRHTEVQVEGVICAGSMPVASQELLKISSYWSHSLIPPYSKATAEVIGSLFRRVGGSLAVVAPERSQNKVSVAQ